MPTNCLKTEREKLAAMEIEFAKLVSSTDDKKKITKAATELAKQCAETNNLFSTSPPDYRRLIGAINNYREAVHLERSLSIRAHERFTERMEREGERLANL